MTAPGARPLASLRVVEVAQHVAGPYCAKLLADLGAEVVKVEPPDGDAARRLPPFVATGAGAGSSVPFLHLNTGKRSVALDLPTDAGVDALTGLAAGADVVVVDAPLGALTGGRIDEAALLAVDPRLVVLSLTPYGLTGPDRDRPAAPLTTFHASGEGYLTPVGSALVPDVRRRPPLRQGRFAGEYKLATYASGLLLAAVVHARATGVGQLVDVSKQDALIGLNYLEVQPWLLGRPVPDRASIATGLGGIFRCRDGYLEFTFKEERQWHGLVMLMGDPAWAGEPWALTAAGRGEHAREINEAVARWLAGRDRAEVVAAGQRVGCTVAPYHSIAEYATSAHARAREVLQDVEHPTMGTRPYPTAPYRFSGRPVVPGPAPELGQHTDEPLPAVPARAREAPAPAPARAPERPCRGALEGVRVLDFTWAVAGPTATMILAGLGAEVIRVESAARPDLTRRGWNSSQTVNREKRSITLNLRHPAARELVGELVTHAQVVAESFRPKVMDRLGLDYATLAARRPDLVMLSSSMAGPVGPYADFAGYAPMFVAVSGLGEMTGYADGPPSQVRVGGDVVVGIHGALAVLAGLVQRDRSGQGSHIDLSAIDCQAALVGDSILDFTLNGAVPTRSGNDEPGIAPHDCYPCAGADGWLCLVVDDDADWLRFGTAIGSPAWAGDPRFATAVGRWAHRRELDGAIATWTSRHDARVAAGILVEAGLKATPSFALADLFDDPHVAARGLVVEVPGEHGPVPLVRLGGRLSATPLRARTAGPALGEANDEVFGGLLGLSRSEISRLAAEGVLT